MRTHTDEVVYDGTVRVDGIVFRVRICRALITCHNPVREYVTANFYDLSGESVIMKLSVSMPWAELMSMTRGTQYRTWPAMLQAVRDCVMLSGKTFPCTLGRRLG